MLTDLCWKVTALLSVISLSSIRALNHYLFSVCCVEPETTIGGKAGLVSALFELTSSREEEVDETNKYKMPGARTPYPGPGESGETSGSVIKAKG